MKDLDLMLVRNSQIFKKAQTIDRHVMTGDNATLSVTVLIHFLNKIPVEFSPVKHWGF